MAKKAGEKIIDGLTQLLEGFRELEEMVAEDFGSDETEAEVDDEDIRAEREAAIVNEMRASIEAVIETEGITSEEVASTISAMTEALQEIDPDIFEEASGEESETDSTEAEDDDDDLDDDDLDEDDDDLYDEDEDDEDDDD